MVDGTERCSYFCCGLAVAREDLPSARARAAASSEGTRTAEVEDLTGRSARPWRARVRGAARGSATGGGTWSGVGDAGPPSRFGNGIADGLWRDVGGEGKAVGDVSGGGAASAALAVALEYLCVSEGRGGSAFGAGGSATPRTCCSLRRRGSPVRAMVTAEARMSQRAVGYAACAVDSHLPLAPRPPATSACLPWWLHW